MQLQEEIDAGAYGLDGIEELEAVRAIQPEIASRLNTWSAKKSADLTATASGIPNGSAASVSTGLPYVTRLAMFRLRRYAAA